MRASNMVPIADVTAMGDTWIHEIRSRLQALPKKIAACRTAAECEALIRQALEVPPASSSLAR